MKTLLIAGVTLVLLTGHALAQTSSPPGTENDHPEADHSMPPPPPHGMMMADHGHPNAPEKSARFRLRVGDIFLGLTCPDDEPMKACEEFAMHLLDKAVSMERR